MGKKQQQVPIDAIKAIWEKYSDIVLEGYADQLEEAVCHRDKAVTYDIKKITDKMKAFRHEFNKKT